MKPHAPEPPADREIRLTRVINAPRERVFEAFTQPEQMALWWGPNGFTTTMFEMDVRPGGVCRFLMHGPDGTDYPNLKVYREVVPPSRLVYDYRDEVEGSPNFEVTVTFEARGDQTLLTMVTIFPTRACRDHVVKEHDAIEGGKQTLNRLEAFLIEQR